ncbi:MAG: phosphatidylglycerol lysyltransferase domain-containing protein [Bacteroidales bacterium]|nr:phosphatidylglycerol lysyltransferase domain-containing protein [Bacteroidales bacterium]
MIRRVKNFTTYIFNNKFIWQLFLAVFMVGLAIFFISHEHLEVLKIRNQLLLSNSWYVLTGMVLTVVYFFLMGLMYVYSFRAIGQKIPLLMAVRLFLKRNFVSVFLPAGGFSSLLFFTKEAEDNGVSKSQIHLASTLFGCMSFLSVLVVSLLVVLFCTLFLEDMPQMGAYGFISLLILTAFIVFLIISIFKKGKVYRLFSRLMPSVALVLDEMIEQDINRKEVLKSLFFSILIEVIGILHLYIAMLALGFEPSWPAAILGYIVMVVLLMASPFLRGFGAIEVSVTYVLGQFGFPVVAAAAITLLYRFFEFWLPLIVGLLTFFSKRDNLLLRILPACLIFTLGVVNILSFVTPALPDRLLILKDFLPEDMINASNGMVLVSGLLLLILSVFLLQGSKRAWYVGLILTVFSFVGHLFKGVDYEEATLAFVAFAMLIYTRRNYKFKPHPELTRISYMVLIYSIVALFAFGLTGFAMMDKRHFGIDFEFWASVENLFRLFFLFDDTGLPPQTKFAQNFIYFMYFLGGLEWSFIFFSVLKPHFSHPYNSEEDRILAKNILKKYKKSSIDYFKVYSDKFYFFSEDKDGFVSFKVTNFFAVVLGDPVCENDDALVKLLQSFERFCQDSGFMSVYYRVPQRSLAIYKKLGKKSLPIGEEAIVELTDFTLEGVKMKLIRNEINSVETQGFEVKIYDAPVKAEVLQKMEHVSSGWLHVLDLREIAFSQGVFDKGILHNQTIVTVENRKGKVFAFLNIIPDGVSNEATYDLIRKRTDAPLFVLDLLIAKTLLYFREKGYLYANLGLAPLSGVKGSNLKEKAMKFTYENLKSLGHFKSLRSYKEKFHPKWETKFLIYDNDYDLLQMPNVLKKVLEGKKR